MCIIVYRCSLRHNAENYKRNKKKWDGQTKGRKISDNSSYDTLYMLLCPKQKGSLKITVKDGGLYYDRVTYWVE